MPHLLAFQRSNDHIRLSVDIAGSRVSLLFADSSCCVHRMFLSCQYHAYSWTKYPSRSHLLPLHPLATLLSYCMLPYYTLLTLVLCCTDLNLRHVKFMRPTPAARRGLLLLLLLFTTHLVSMPSHRNVDLYTADEYGYLLYDGIDKTVHGAPQLLRLILDEPTLRGQDSTIQQPLRPASHTISASDINTVKCCGDGNCVWHSLLNGRNRPFGQVCIHVRCIPFIITASNSCLPVCANRLY